MTYRKIDTRIWNDAKFCRLSLEAQHLFFCLITHPSLTVVGAMRMTQAGLEAELGRLPGSLSEAFREVFREGLVEGASDAPLIVVRNFLRYNRPMSPNVVKTWPEAFDRLPECELKVQLFQRCKAEVDALSEAFPKAFAEAFPKGMGDTFPKQEVRSEKGEVGRENTGGGGSRARVAPSEPEPPPPPPPPEPEIELSQDGEAIAWHLRRLETWKPELERDYRRTIAKRCARAPDLARRVLARLEGGDEDALEIASEALCYRDGFVRNGPADRWRAMAGPNGSAPAKQVEGFTTPKPKPQEPDRDAMPAQIGGVPTDGRAAYEAGHPMAANPFEEGFAAHGTWQLHWKSAEIAAQQEASA